MKFYRKPLLAFLIAINLASAQSNAEEPTSPPDKPAFTISHPPPFVTVEMRQPENKELLEATLEWFNRNRIESRHADEQPDDVTPLCRFILDPAETERDYKTAIDIKTKNKTPVVILHTAALHDSEISPKDYNQRVIKEALRGVLLAFDMPACVFFLCNMYEHENSEALDRKSTNPCPPCQGNFEEWLKEHQLLPQVHSH